MSRALCSEKSQLSLLRLFQMLLQRLLIYTLGKELLTKKNNTSCLCKKHAQRCMLLQRSKSTQVLISNYSPPLRQLGSDFWCSSGTKPPFPLLLEFQKIADLKSLPCLLTAQLLTRGASRLKLANQRVRCVTFHCIIRDREQDKAQYLQALTPILLAALPSAHRALSHQLRSNQNAVRERAKVF